MNARYIQFLQFSSVGAIGTFVHYGILLVLVNGLSSGALEASSAGFVGGALTNYLLNYRYTFASRKSHHDAMTKFFIVAVIGMAFNGLILSFCIHVLDLYYLLSQVIATLLVLVWNFAANCGWTFRENSNEA